MSEPSDNVASQKQPAQKKMGRPTKYSPEIAAIILTRIAEGESLRQITMEKDMPSHASVYLWLTLYKDFSENYARARDEQADTLADEIIAIADQQPDLDPLYDKDGQLIEMRMHSAYIQWQKNRVDARKWVAAKLKPKKYGDRQIIAGDKDNPLEVSVDKGFFTDLAAKFEQKRREG